MNETAESIVWDGVAGGAPDLISLGGALLGVCLLIYVGVWLTAKLLKLAPQHDPQAPELSRVASLRLGKDSTLHVVRAGARALLIGDGARGVTLLAELDELAAAEDLLAEPSEPEAAEAPADDEAPEGATRRLPRGLTLAAALLVALLLPSPAQAQGLGPLRSPSGSLTGFGQPSGFEPQPRAPGVSAPGFPQLNLSDTPAAAASLGDDGGSLSVKLKAGGKGGLASAMKVAFILTALMFLPAILTSVTAFTRVVIVLSFVRRAIGSNTSPPNQVLVGLSLFLTLFVMAPVGQAIHARAYVPYTNDEIKELEAVEITTGLLKRFMLANTRPKDLGSFVELSRTPPPATQQELPFWVVTPAFMTSELRTAFLMAFAIYLPFLVIDLVVASALLSVGLIMVPPPLISAPLKILLFVLADGWYLLCRGLVLSFNVPGVTS